MRQPRFAPRRQEGAILVIALIVLVLVTIVSVATIRSATVEEKMAGNTRDREKALQAAEAAARACLAKISAGTYTGTFPTQLTAATSGSEQWDIETNWASNSANSLEVSVDTTLSAQPRCMIEALGTNGSYRVTARANGSSATTVVMLQATYSVE